MDFLISLVVRDVSPVIATPKAVWILFVTRELGNASVSLELWAKNAISVPSVTMDSY